MANPWECPRCKRINAPSTPYCDCKPEASAAKEYSALLVAWEATQQYSWCIRCQSPHDKNLQCAYLGVNGKTWPWPPRIEGQCMVCNGYHSNGVQCATLTVT